MYNDDLKDVPKEIVVKMLERQKDQGNSYFGVKALEKNRYAQRDEGGFDWDTTLEGGDFWETVLEHDGWEAFFDLYPTSDFSGGQMVYDSVTFKPRLIPHTPKKPSRPRFPLEIGDTFKNSGGKLLTVKQVNGNQMWYIHENNTLYEEETKVIIERLERGLYTEYKSSKSVRNNKSKTSKNEVHRENSEQGRPTSKGSRVIRKKVEVASASRPVGSRISSIRKRSGARKSTISGSRLLIEQSS